MHKGDLTMGDWCAMVDVSRGTRESAQLARSQAIAYNRILRPFALSSIPRQGT